MPKRLTAKTISAMKPPEKGNRIDWEPAAMMQSPNDSVFGPPAVSTVS